MRELFVVAFVTTALLSVCCIDLSMAVAVL